MTDFTEQLSDALARSELDWSPSRPEPTECVECGNLVEPAEHPFREAWLEPGERCEECEAEHRRTQRDLGHRRELFEPRFEHCGAGEQLRTAARRHYERDKGDIPAPLEGLIRQNPDEAGDTRGVYLWGDTGGGKSTMAVAAIARFHVRWLFGLDGDVRPEPRFRTARFVRLSAVFEEAKDTFDDPASAWSWSRYVEADLLVLDEVGREPHHSGWVSRVVDRIINARYEDDGLTIFTSNLPPKGTGPDQPGLAEANPDVYDDRMVRRIMETCGDRAGPPHCYRVTDDHELRHDTGGWNE